MLFVDKYAPKNIEDILGNTDVIQTVSNMKMDFPHLLLTGPPGTGKTTLAHLVKKDFDTLELNASDERGIDTIRNTLKNFCYKNTPNKLVVLDECDHLTTQAQQALRRLMEVTDTKFILICNQISQVIEPIQSRCAVLRFERVSSDVFLDRIREICEIESIKITESGLKALVEIGSGDIRAVLSCLQGISKINRTVDDEFIYKLNGIPNTKIIVKILDLIKSKSLDKALEAFEDLWGLKFECSDILDGFFKVAKMQDNYELLKIVGKYQIRINEGVKTKVQFYSMFDEIYNKM